MLRQINVVSLRMVQDELNVSEMTVRRDFAALEEMGVVRKTRGGVMLVGAQPGDVLYEHRETVEIAAKRAIGECAAGLIQPGDTIFLSGGTTCLQVAVALAQATDVVVVTNSVEALVRLSRNPSLTVLATGGRASHLDRDLTGPVAHAGVRQHRVSKAFVGASGVAAPGIFNSNLERGWIDQAMLECAASRYVLADHTKIGKESLMLVAEAGGVDHLVTDVRPDEHDLGWMGEAGIEVHVAEPPNRLNAAIDEPAGGMADASKSDPGPA